MCFNRAISRRSFHKAVFSGLAAGLAWPAGQAMAQSDLPVRVVIPFPPGGSNDIVGRAIAHELSLRLNRSFVVENAAGAGGTIGATAVSRAKPDGNTLLLISAAFPMSASVMKLNYDPVASFSPIALLGKGPSVLVVNADLPVNSIQELLAYSKNNPGVLNFGSAGVGSLQHFAAELLKLRTGIDLTIVHYKGGGPALNDLASGHVHVCLGSLIQMLSYVKAGKVKIIGVTGTERVSLIPEVHTLKEDGVDVEISNWWGLLAPTGTPDVLLDGLNREINAILSAEDVKTRFANEGATPTPDTRAAFTDYLAQETEKWAEVARLTGIGVG